MGSPLGRPYCPCIPDSPDGCDGGTRPLWTAADGKEQKKHIIRQRRHSGGSIAIQIKTRRLLKARVDAIAKAHETLAQEPRVSFSLRLACSRAHLHRQPTSAYFIKIIANIVEIRARAIMMMTDDTHCTIDSSGAEGETEKSLRHNKSILGNTHLTNADSNQTVQYPQ